MADSIYKYLLNNQAIITAADTRGLAEYARVLHNTYPVSTAIMGRTLTAAALMSSHMFKNEAHRLTLSIKGGGSAGTVLATANGECQVKGYMENPYVDLPAKANGQLDVGGAIGKEGFLTVVRDTGAAEPYIGKTPIVTGEIAEDLAMYFLQSEQQPTIVYLNTWVDIDTTVLTAGGLIIAPLPGAEEDTLSFIESCIPAIQNYGMMLMQNTAAQAVEKIFAGGNLVQTEQLMPMYVCDCSRERFERGIIAIGAEELKKIIEEDGRAEVKCQFCNKTYEFTEMDLKRLLNEAES